MKQVDYIHNSKIFSHKLNITDHSLSNNQDEIYPSIFKLSEKDYIDTYTYPDSEYSVISSKAKSIYNLNHLLWGAGTEDLILRVNRMISSSKVGVILPTFYRIYQTLAVFEPIAVDYSLGKDYIDISSMEFQIIRKKISVLWITNPNPLLGKLIRKEDIKYLLEKFPNILFIVDESCIDLTCKNTDIISVLEYTKDYANILVLRSFSKLYGLAGIRVGFIAGDSKLLNLLKKDSITFPLSNIAVLLTEKALDKIDSFKDIVRNIHQNKSIIETKIKKLEIFTINKSITNCIIIKNNLKDTYTDFLQKGILSLNLNHHLGIKEKGFVRITVFSSTLKNELLNNVICGLH